MKKYRLAIILLTLLPLAVTLIALPLLPESIPAHFNVAGEADRWGSKYEMLIFPALNIGFTILMAQIARLAARQEGSGENNDRIFGIATLLCLLLFDAMALYFLWAAFSQTTSLNELAFDVNQLMMAFLGLLMIVMGNLMPKTRRNSMLGLRTSFSQKSDDAWKVSQRIGGAGMMIIGVITLVISLLTRGMLCIMLSLAVLLVGVIIITVTAERAVSKSNR